MANDPKADPNPVQAVPDPIINSPYEEPEKYWLYTEGIPKLMDGRRPAGYWYKDKRAGSAQLEFFAEEERDDLPLVNALRQDVSRWRSSEYRGASKTTKDLLKHWASPEGPIRRLFFCQQEAVETLIYLLEMRIPRRSASTKYRKFEVSDENLARLLNGKKPKGKNFQQALKDFFPSLIDPSDDPDHQIALQRLGVKMATGTGKTVVMAMLIAWAFCNRAPNPENSQFPNGVLICCPNLTVKSRLQVLDPGNSCNYYDEFGIVPAKYRELLNTGSILVTNWHVFGKKSPNSEDTFKVVDKGEETNDAFAKNRIGDLVNRLPILVFNDEGHHCWRPKISKEKLDKEETTTLEKEEATARIWLDGLDRINNAGLLDEGKGCISTVVDLSATPFSLKGSGRPEGQPFPWLVSDFGLVDAIEAGIVKIPRLPVLDDTGRTDEANRPDPQYFRLWKNINDSIGKTERLSNRRPKPEAVLREAEGALRTLTAQWKERFDHYESATALQESIPPVMIVVCDNTEIAEIFFQKISGERIEEVLEPGRKKPKPTRVFNPAQALLPELGNTEDSPNNTVKIDTKTFDKLIADDGTSKDDKIANLREIIDTVGKKDQPGEQVRCIVSVSMLTEGWDANNVTNILGVRAFLSQLLCEQVVGRGLRRISYTPDPETGLLPPEYVDVYGIPFSIIPFKGRPQDTKATEDKPRNHVYALSDREAYEIRFPVVEAYVYALRKSGIRCNVDELEELVIDRYEAQEVFVEGIRGYKDDPHTHQKGDLERHTREAFYQNVHFQMIEFEIARLIVGDLIQGSQATEDEKALIKLQSRHQLFPEVLAILREYIAKKIRFDNEIDPRELGLQKNSMRVIQRVRDGILPAAASEEAPLLPVINSFKPFLSTRGVDFTTVRPTAPITKSHLNAIVYHSKPELRAAELLDEADCVEFFAPNEKVELQIPYDYLGESHYYVPDFLVRIPGSKTVILEIKGGGGEAHGDDEDKVRQKNAATKKWCSAVNNHGDYGRWDYLICYEDDIEQLPKLLAEKIDEEPSSAIAG